MGALTARSPKEARPGIVPIAALYENACCPACQNKGQLTLMCKAAGLFLNDDGKQLKAKQAVLAQEATGCYLNYDPTKPWPSDPASKQQFADTCKQYKLAEHVNLDGRGKWHPPCASPGEHETRSGDS